MESHIDGKPQFFPVAEPGLSDESLPLFDDTAVNVQPRIITDEETAASIKLIEKILAKNEERLKTIETLRQIEEKSMGKSRIQTNNDMTTTETTRPRMDSYQEDHSSNSSSPVFQKTCTYPMRLAAAIFTVAVISGIAIGTTWFGYKMYCSQYASVGLHQLVNKTTVGIIRYPETVDSGEEYLVLNVTKFLHANWTSFNS